VTDRIVRCRVHTRRGNPCTGEAVDPEAELQICIRHLAEAHRLIQAGILRSERGGAK
jgi:nitrite reductase/ring-hydroxylating ferredoxin subunit